MDDLKLCPTCGALPCDQVDDNSGWQPIETAPKDGTRILIYNKGNMNDEPPIASFVRVDWYRTDKKLSGFIGFGLENKKYFPHSHWKPLPEPPQEN